MFLIPAPRKITMKEGRFDLRREAGGVILVVNGSGQALHIARKLCEGLSGALHKEFTAVSADDTAKTGIALEIIAPGSGLESYDLDVSDSGIVIRAAGEPGLFYGIQTLLQMVAAEGAEVPYCVIADSPDFAARGFLHDVTRGKVPTLATLKLLADTLAFFKINQLHLYIEHTFAFKNIPELWQGADPLTADEIVELDAYCRGNFIDLVPTLATFGHLYELLRIERFEHLNELDIRASALPHNLWDRMAHYTIDAGSDEAFLLVKSMLDEFLPLFSSKRCNICCDETFDLGKGKNSVFAAAPDGLGRLYVDFVNKLSGVVRSHGKKAMIWSDIVLKYPLVMDEIADDTVFLTWGYGADVPEDPVRTLARTGVEQYVCPGVSGWSRFANALDTASANIRAMIRYGAGNGAAGVLVTDWGDCGHVNMLANSFHGMALGAALSWNTLSYPDDRDFDAAFSALEWGDCSGAVTTLQRELGSLCFYHFGNLYAWATRTDGLWDKEKEVRSYDCGELEKRYQRATVIYNAFLSMKKNSGTSWNNQNGDEFVFSAQAVRWTLALLAFKKRNEYRQCHCPALYTSKDRLLEDGKEIVHTFERLWRKRNKESELRNVTMTFHKAFERIQSIEEPIVVGNV